MVGEARKLDITPKHVKVGNQNLVRTNLVKPGEPFNPVGN